MAGLAFLVYKRTEALGMLHSTFYDIYEWALQRRPAHHFSSFGRRRHEKERVELIVAL